MSVKDFTDALIGGLSAENEARYPVGFVSRISPEGEGRWIHQMEPGTSISKLAIDLEGAVFAATVTELLASVPGFWRY